MNVNVLGCNLPNKHALYRYEKLEEPDYIRVLTLLPSPSSSSAIHIYLSSVKLSQELQYDAVSYTWATSDGDASLSSPIYCNGHQISVTKNCVSFLEKLRRQDVERTLWVDAICINQNSLKERCQQVGLMGAIYRQANQVLIWLGYASSNLDPDDKSSVSSLFFNYLAPMATQIRDTRPAGQWEAYPPLYNSLVKEAADYVSFRKLTPLVQGFLDVVKRPWWERVWVVQEAALAKSALVICGEYVADYADLYDLFVQVRTSSSHESGLTLSLLDGYKHHMYAVFTAKDQAYHFGPAKSQSLILGKSRRLQATNKRDHLFALSDICDPAMSGLPKSDYNKSVAEVFIEFTVLFIKQLGPYNILREATTVEDTLGIPSWVPNWSQRPQFHTPASEGSYHASGRSSPRYIVDDNGRELQIFGKCIDALDQVKKAEISAYHYPYVPSKGFLGYQQSCRVGLSMSTYPTGEDIKEVLWRTLCWNMDADLCVPAANELAVHFEKFYSILFSGKDMETMEKEILEDAANFNDICIHSMPLTVTSNGYLASVPWTAEKGDQIIIFSGVELPFLLRPQADGQSYHLIGACYVHGCMKGEIFPENSEDLKWFSIR